MKKLNFETSKGKFVVVDLPNATHFFKHKGYIVQSCTDKLDLLAKCNKIDNGDTNWFWCIGNTTNEYVLKDITEQKASEIVEDKYNQSNYGQYNPTAIHRLHSLIKSKGYYLFENPNDNYCGTIEYQQEEEKTFFNPIIFKLL